MVDPTLTISIDRSALTLSPLVLKGHPATDLTLGVTDYTEPAMQARIAYAPTSAYLHGETPLGWSYQETMLNFSVATFNQATEAASRGLVAELLAAITQFSYVTTVTVDGAPAEGWRCRPGSLVPVGRRSMADIAHHIPEWAVSLPCHPVRSVA